MGANTVGLSLLRHKEPVNLVTYCLIKKYDQISAAVIINHFFAVLPTNAAILLASALS